MMYICENCKKEHDGSYGSGRFCSKECAKSYSSNHNKNRTKEVFCSSCGNIQIVPINARLKDFLCDECKIKRIKEITKIKTIQRNIENENKKEIKRRLNIEKRQIRKCSICGNLYFTKDGCQNEFCKTHSIQMFKSLIKYFKFDKSKLGTQEVENEYNRVRDMLYDLYWNKNMSTYDLARMFNYKSNPTNIAQKFFKGYLNIPVKDLSYAVREGYLMGRQEVHSDPKYKCGWHETWDGRKVYLRSSYELDYAIELDNKKIYYDVECLRIKYFDTQQNKNRIAIPDFYIHSTNTIVEIKGRFTLDLQNMIDKKKSYIENGYNFKLIYEHKEKEI